MDIVRADRGPAAEHAAGTVELNPPGVDEHYLRGLRVAFGSLWTKSMYHFHFARPFAEQAPDRVVLRYRGRIVSGIGVNYRSLRLKNGAMVRAGILTGGWTSTASRGRGLFGRVIESATRVIAGRGCALALAFMKAANPSARVLRRLGAQMLPTTYLSSGPGILSTRTIARNRRIHSIPPAVVQATAARDTPGGELQFHYPRPEEWRLQFLERPHPVDTLAIGDCVAIVERTPDTDRLQLLTGDTAEQEAVLEALVLRARRDHRGFVAFTLGKRCSEPMASEGMIAEPGYLTVLVTGREALAAALEIPARQATRGRANLASWRSVWYPGAWRIQAGDRM